MDTARPFAVVTPTLDGDALARLALADASFTAGELRRLIPHASVDGIRKALNRLSEQGIVEARRAGPAITYRMNRDHVSADAVVELARWRERTLERFAHAVDGWTPSPVYGALFGSWVRGDATPSSDLDVFLVRPTAADPDRWDELVSELEREGTRWTGNDTRALVLAEDHVRAEPDDPVLRSVVEEGVRFAGSSSWLRRHVRAGPRS
ncbi:hypothetical protein JOE63_000804 [Cellulosimicrobium cellulans]|jgi:hypothetical protein|uniref:Polymerase nucleotidyl transferase domain-containing protein n=1 Tax=Cellulosimicrobium cellulans TaxID=1710 RepID=A0A1Y0HUS6_CELCE|nr:nucleotidyltransferase domain-containing protein [Cellulosimicrobium cellulans]ARU51829.1 hypothetical protein CBR64_10350 [Cellulosimicrobium cellulans]MBM7818327.1 hypothetical protein [Cellulosimicrobium cellulans]